MAASETAIDLDPATHTYRVGGVVFPGVTQILGEAGLVDSQWYTEESQYRGRKIHVMTALDDRGELNESAVTDEYRGYLDAWRKFRSDTDCKILEIETRVYEPDYRFCGTVDRVVQWLGWREPLDIKSGVGLPWHALQLAAYAMCIGSSGPRHAVYLSKSGTYKVQQYDGYSERDVFLAALALANWNRNHGVTNVRNSRSDAN